MKQLLLVIVALVASVGLSAQQKTSGGSTTSGGMSEGHQAGSVFTEALSESITLTDSISVHRRLVLNISDSLGLVDSFSAAHRLAIADTLRLSDNLIVDYIANYRPTAFSDTGQDQNDNPSPCVSDGNAIDGNPSTFTLCGASRDQSLFMFTNKLVRYFGFPSKNGSPSTIDLNVISSSAVNSHCTSSSMGMQYSLNGGSSWTNVPGQTGIYSQNTATIALGSTQDFTQVQVRGSASCHTTNGGLATANLTINEIWIFAE